MRINEANSELLTADHLTSTRNGTGGGANQITESSNPMNRSDKVQIYGAGRAMALPEREDRVELSPQRLEEIRGKISEGAYDSLDSVDQLARRILASGDL